MRQFNFSTVFIIVAALSTSLASSREVLAQAGDLGGQVGKKNRSISGVQETPAPSKTPPPKRRAAAPSQDNPQETKTTGCENFFGVWTSGGGSWLYGPNDTTFSAGGTALHNSGIVGTWRRSNGEIVLEWKSWDNDRLKLSADGKRLNSLVGGKGFTR